LKEKLSFCFYEFYVTSASNAIPFACGFFRIAEISRKRGFLPLKFGDIRQCLNGTNMDA
jgi:hypothetical protein